MAVQASLLGCSTASVLTTDMELFEMKSGLFLSATASLMLLAQSYAAPGAVTMKPGQIQSVDPSSQASAYAAQPDVGIVSLKPGETVNTASSQDLGSVQAGATSLDSGYQMLKPGQAG
jgi:hypothetical protein